VTVVGVRSFSICVRGGKNDSAYLSHPQKLEKHINMIKDKSQKRHELAGTVETVPLLSI